MDNATRKRIVSNAKTLLEHSPSQIEHMQANGMYAAGLALTVIADIMIEWQDDLYVDRESQQ